MKVEIKRINSDYLLEANGASGIPVLMDNKSEENVQGSSPMELVLMGVGGCSAIDIISILKKQKQEISDYRVVIEAERKKIKEALPFDSILVKIHLEGNVSPEKAKRAAFLSFEKYCSVSLSLDPTISITYQVYVNGDLID